MLVKVSAVDLPTRVSVVVGRVSVPVFMMFPMIGEIKVLLVRVWVAVNPARVSVASGKVMVLLTVVAEARVSVVAVVAEDETKPIFLVASVPSVKKTLALARLLLVKVSVVALPMMVSVVVGRVSVAAPLVMVEMMGVVRVAELMVGEEAMTKVDPVPV